MIRTKYWIALFIVLSIEIIPEADGMLENMLDFRYFRCVMKREWKCPDSEINFFLFTPERPFRQWIDVRKPKLLDIYGWNPMRKNVMIIHGFNGTSTKTPMTFIRDAYLSRKDYNVFMVDWSPLTRFPCYLSSLSNLKLAAQCSAQLYAYITHAGALARMTTCVGHSLGAHVCGMISNHLTEKQYKIIAHDLDYNVYPSSSWTFYISTTFAPMSLAIYLLNILSANSVDIFFNNLPKLLQIARTGLDPARPLVSQYGSRQFRLTRDDAHVVQVVHTNAGFLGESGQIGHADFCVNGGKRQPGCQGHFMRISRCSHFMSSCYFAASVRKRLRIVGVPCDSTCPKVSSRWGIDPGRKAVKLGDDVPDSSRGMYCVSLKHEENCPFD